MHVRVMVDDDGQETTVHERSAALLISGVIPGRHSPARAFFRVAPCTPTRFLFGAP